MLDWASDRFAPRIFSRRQLPPLPTREAYSARLTSVNILLARAWWARSHAKIGFCCRQGLPHRDTARNVRVHSYCFFEVVEG
jgi:hypothetical protein